MGRSIRSSQHFDRQASERTEARFIGEKDVRAMFDSHRELEGVHRFEATGSADQRRRIADRRRDRNDLDVRGCEDGSKRCLPRGIPRLQWPDKAFHSGQIANHQGIAGCSSGSQANLCWQTKGGMSFDDVNQDVRIQVEDHDSSAFRPCSRAFQHSS